MIRYRRRTHCTIAGHGTRCEAARERADGGRYARATERTLALHHEREADR